MSTIKIYLQKILSLLHVRSMAGGLEISDQVLRLVYFNGKTWQMTAIRLAPGVMEKGKIKDTQALITALRELKLKVPFAKNKKKKMNVVVSLSSVAMYSQVFTLPLMEGQDLNSAVDLNVRMLSPVDVNQTYFGWEILGTDDVNVRSEIAAAFVDKGIVDEMTQVLYTAGFITVGVESRALALVRIFRQKGAGVDVNKSYLLLNIDNSGIDFLIIRKGRLYFEYSNQWSELADDKGQIAIPKFEELLTASLRQVINFSAQHWPEPLSAVILSAVAFEKESEAIIQTSAGLPVIRLTLVMGQPVSSEWLVALGCSLRGINANLKDKEINLSGEGAIDTFHKEQLIEFLTLWRALIPSVLSFLVIIFIVGNRFLVSTRASIGQTASPAGQQSQEVQAFLASSTAFNASVALISNVESQLNKNYEMIGDIENVAEANGITINHISFQGSTAPILVSGVAQAQSQIITFKNAIQADTHFGTVDLPLSNIQQGNGGYTFSMQFPLSTVGF